MAKLKIRFDITHILGRTHVGTSYRDVLDDFAARIDNNLTTPAPRLERARILTDAAIQHRRNRLDYAWVMGSH